jgi:hypothetical protein
MAGLVFPVSDGCFSMRALKANENLNVASLGFTKTEACGICKRQSLRFVIDRQCPAD